MTIKEVEQALSVSRANIRFYEKEGLLTANRKSNNYRDYTEENLRNALIKANIEGAKTTQFLGAVKL